MGNIKCRWTALVVFFIEPKFEVEVEPEVEVALSLTLQNTPDPYTRGAAIICTIELHYQMHVAPKAPDQSHNHLINHFVKGDALQIGNTICLRGIEKF